MALWLANGACLAGIALQTQEIRYSGRLATRLALWLANCAYFGRNWRPNSRTTRFSPAGFQHCAVARKRCIFSLEPASKLGKYAILHEFPPKRPSSNSTTTITCPIHPTIVAISPPIHQPVPAVPLPSTPRIPTSTKTRTRQGTRPKAWRMIMIRTSGCKPKMHMNIIIKATRLVWPGGMSGAPES